MPVIGIAFSEGEGLAPFSGVLSPGSGQRVLAKERRLPTREQSLPISKIGDRLIEFSKKKPGSRTTVIFLGALLSL